MEDHKNEVIENTTEEQSAPSRSRSWLTFTLLVALVAGMATSSALAGSVDPSVIGSYYLQAAKSAVGADAEEGKACSSKNAEGKACSSKDKAAKAEGAACSSKDKEAKAEGAACSSKDKEAKAEGAACSSKDKEAKAEGAACSSKDKEAKAEGKACCSSKDKAAKAEDTKEEPVQVSKAE